MRWPWLLSLFLISPASAEDITVFAAASLAGPLDRVAHAFTAQTGHEVTLSYAGSSSIARQVEQGAPADVVFLANIDWMDHLEAAQAIRPGTRRDLLGNRLVIVMNTTHLADADVPPGIGDGRIAMALVDAVPAGIYGRMAFEASGVWDALRPQVIETDNVRAALRLVVLGAAQTGVVYATDAMAEPGVAVIETLSATLHPPIVYPAALTPHAPEPGRAFLDWLAGDAARALFRDAGFAVIDE
ncbi:molybdate ABC transporter substrate-binding protein [Gymnodinialimonas ulvae]|uniref:molybdate ABC transporter substrate-binding protein n=1 Tax=Gymnodinialimonas ulvae TaxID=3126504 RepID=UPI0030A7D6D4